MLPLLQDRDGDEAAAPSAARPARRSCCTGDDIDLGRLPIQTCWPGEPAPLITWPLVVTKGPADAREDDFNLGIYRMQVTGPRTRTLMRWLQASRRRPAPPALAGRPKREPLPAAAVIGADPGTILAAVTPVPDTLSEYQFAGLLRGKQVELVDCKTVPLKVPADGRDRARGPCQPRRVRRRGPLRRPHRLLQRGRALPGVHASRAITMRRDPIYLSTFTGRPPDEPSVLGEALNEVFIPLFSSSSRRSSISGCRPRAARYRIAVVSMQEGLSRPRQARDDGRLVATCASSCTPSS